MQYIIPRFTHRLTLRSVVAVSALALAAALLTLAVPAQARGGGGGGGGFRGGGGGGFGGGGSRGGGFSTPSQGFSSSQGSFGRSPQGAYPGTQVPRTNVNTGDINRNSGNTVNVNQGSDWGWGGSGAWGAAAVGAATGAAVGAAYGGSGPSYTTVVPSAPQVIYSLPSGCSPVYSNGMTYQYCDGTYYEPGYQGSDIVYQPVPPP